MITRYSSPLLNYPRNLTAIVVMALHRQARIAALVLVAVFVLCGVGGIVHAINGWTFFTKGTRTDATGLDIGSTSDRTCFLSGVAGNLSLGAEAGFGCATRGEQSVALVSRDIQQGRYKLVAHGGACENQADKKVWRNNPVKAQATCVLSTTDVIEGHWTSDQNRPLKIADLGPPKRQCFLSGLSGVSGSWNNSGRFARVLRVTAASGRFPTPGWYIDANLPRAVDNSRAYVDARCVTFPPDTSLFPVGIGPLPVTTGFPISVGPGIKACALTAVGGQFTANSWHNGVLMTPPPTVDGPWVAMVTKGKSAFWTCAR